MDDSSVTGWLVAARAIHIAGCLLTASVWFFDRVIVTRTMQTWRRAATVLLLTAAPLMLLSGAAWFLLVAAELNDLSIWTILHSPHALEIVWLQTRFGRTWQIHLAVFIAEIFAATVWLLLRRGAWAGFVFGFGLVAGLAWAGHGSTGLAPQLHLTADLAHLMTAAVWPAGLVPLAVLLARQTALPANQDWLDLAKVTRRFSTCSLAAVALLGLTGFVNSWSLLGSWHALSTSHYGHVLLVKLALFQFMLVIGAVNLLVVAPRISRGKSTARKLHRNVIIEIVLGVGVIVIIGLLGLLEPMAMVH